MKEFEKLKEREAIKVLDIPEDKIKEANQIFKEAFNMSTNIMLKEQAKEIFVDVEDFYNNNEHTGFEEELKAWFKLKDKWLK